MTYQPKPTAAYDTGMTYISPRREGTVVGFRASFEDTFGGYTPPEWTLDAECTQPGTDPRLFFPTRGGRAADQAALASCAVCVVREQCLEDALRYEVGEIGMQDVRPEVHGIRGGMTEKARDQLVRGLRAERLDRVKKAVIADYAEGLMKVEDIAAKHGVHSTSVTKWSRDAGVPVRGRGGDRRSKAS